MATEFESLTPGEEDAFHRKRLFAIEQRPLQRLTSRLLSESVSIFNEYIHTHDPAHHHPSVKNQSEKTPAPNKDATESYQPLITTTTNSITETNNDEIRKQKNIRWARKVFLAIKFFEHALIRQQLLLNSSTRECEYLYLRKTRITDAHMVLSASTSALQVRLRSVRLRFGLRQRYDELAKKIFLNNKLKSRTIQLESIEILNTRIQKHEHRISQLDRQWEFKKKQFLHALEEAKRTLAGPVEEDENDIGTDLDVKPSSKSDLNPSVA